MTWDRCLLQVTSCGTLLELAISFNVARVRVLTYTLEDNSLAIAVNDISATYTQ
jgi:hypothetical protein